MSVIANRVHEAFVLLLNKILFPVALICMIGLVSCSMPAENRVQQNPENEALVMKYSAAALKGDIAVMQEFLSDDFKQYGPGLKDSVDRAAMLIGWKKAFEEEYTSMSFDRYAMLSSSVNEGRAMGDWVLDWGKITITYKSGKPPVVFWFHSAVRVKNGKINLQRNFFDVADILGQQGFTIVPPDAGK